MELKLGNLTCLSINRSVLIVPLWNWNELRGAVQAEREPRSNCTFMELKFKTGEADFGAVIQF